MMSTMVQLSDKKQKVRLFVVVVSGSEIDTILGIVTVASCRHYPRVAISHCQAPHGRYCLRPSC